MEDELLLDNQSADGVEGGLRCEPARHDYLEELLVSNQMLAELRSVLAARETTVVALQRRLDALERPHSAAWAELHEERRTASLRLTAEKRALDEERHALDARAATLEEMIDKATESVRETEAARRSAEVAALLELLAAQQEILATQQETLAAQQESLAAQRESLKSLQDTLATTIREHEALLATRTLRYTRRLRDAYGTLRATNGR
jgi:hypothetical protein